MNSIRSKDLQNLRVWTHNLLSYDWYNTLQLENRFKGVKVVIDVYKVVQPYFLVIFTEVELRDKANKYAQRFSDYISPSLFQLQLLSTRSTFRLNLKLLEM